MLTGASQAAAAEQSQVANPVTVTTPEPDPNPGLDAVVGLTTQEIRVTPAEADGLARNVEAIRRLEQRMREGTPIIRDAILHIRNDREAAIANRLNEQVGHITRPYRGMSDDCLYGMLQELSKEAHERYIERTERAFPVGQGLGAAVNLPNWGNEPTPAAQPRVAQVGQPPRRD